MFGLPGYLFPAPTFVFLFVPLFSMTFSFSFPLISFLFFLFFLPARSLMCWLAYVPPPHLLRLALHGQITLLYLQVSDKPILVALSQATAL